MNGRELVVGVTGGIAAYKAGDLVRRLANPLAEHAATSLGEILPLTDVAQVESTVAAAEKAPSLRAMTHYAEAAPLGVIGLQQPRQFTEP